MAMMMMMWMVPQCTHMSGNNAISCEKFTDASSSVHPRHRHYRPLSKRMNPFINFLNFKKCEEIIQNHLNGISEFAFLFLGLRENTNCMRTSHLGDIFEPGVLPPCSNI